MAPRRYRIYFNRSEDAPHVWSFDEGSHASEVNVQAFLIEGPASSKYDLSAKDPEPKAWVELYARLDMVGGVACFQAVCP